MKKVITSAWILIFPFVLSAQIGLINGYQSLYAPNWEQKIRQNYELPDIKVFGPSIFTGFNFYLPSKKKGMQWTPEIHFSRHEIEVTASDPDPDDPNFGFGLITDIHRSLIAGATFNGEFFLFRLAHPNGDPALDNMSPFKRGFFLRVGLGLDLLIQRRLNNTFNFGFSGGSHRTATGAGHFRLGFGLEHAISPFLTISPIISSTFYTKTAWATLGSKGQTTFFDPFGNPNYNDSGIDFANAPRDAFIHLQAAIRLGINLKEFRKAFKRG